MVRSVDTCPLKSGFQAANLKKLWTLCPYISCSGRNVLHVAAHIFLRCVHAQTIIYYAAVC